MATLVATIALALIGYVITHRNDVRRDQRQALLDRVNRQLGELYGPLLALVTATDSAWNAYMSRYRPGGSLREPGMVTDRSDVVPGPRLAAWPPPNVNPQRAPTAGEGVTWRLWIREVFMPLNLRMEEVIITKADLLEGDAMPVPFLDLVAHVESYRTVLKRWDEGDYSEQFALLLFPATLRGHVTEQFQLLKREQSRLLGLLNR